MAGIRLRQRPRAVFEPHLQAGDAGVEGGDGGALAVGMSLQVAVFAHQLAMGIAAALHQAGRVPYFLQGGEALRLRIGLRAHGGFKLCRQSRALALCIRQFIVQRVHHGRAAAQLDTIAGLALARPFGFDFDQPDFGGGFGAQRVASGSDLVHRERDLRLQLPHRQPHRAPPIGGQEKQAEQPHDEEAEHEDHRLFDQGPHPHLSRRRLFHTSPRLAKPAA